MLLERQTRDQAAVRAVLDRVKAEKRSSLSAPEAFAVAEAYGLPVPQEGLATSADEAVTLAQRIGFPVVLKIVSPDILHKTEAGGVLVGVDDALAVTEDGDVPGDEQGAIHTELGQGARHPLQVARVRDPDELASSAGGVGQRAQEVEDRH